MDWIDATRKNNTGEPANTSGKSIFKNNILHMKDIY
jgi:hypothetical protein